MIQTFLQLEPTAAGVCAAAGALLYSAAVLPRVREGMRLPAGGRTRTWGAAAVLAAVSVSTTCAVGAAIGAAVSPAVALAAAWAALSL